MFVVPESFPVPCYFSSLQLALGCVPPDPLDRDRGGGGVFGTGTGRDGSRRKLPRDPNPKKKQTSVSFTKQMICQDSSPNGGPGAGLVSGPGNDV